VAQTTPHHREASSAKDNSPSRIKDEIILWERLEGENKYRESRLRLECVRVCKLYLDKVDATNLKWRE
jgi:hypothetical protein